LQTLQPFRLHQGVCGHALGDTGCRGLNFVTRNLGYRHFMYDRVVMHKVTYLTDI